MTTEQDVKRMQELLRKQKKEVSSSREAAKKLLTRFGVMHLLVPKGTNKKVSSSTSH